MFSSLRPIGLTPADHPLRAIRPPMNVAPDRLSPQFSRLYLPGGCVSTALETLLRALLLQPFHERAPSAS